MKSTHDIRRDNLRQLIEDRFGGSQTKFAKEVGIRQPSFVSRLLTDREPTRKNIGSRLARRVETALGLLENFLDTPNLASEEGLFIREYPAVNRDVRFYREPESGTGQVPTDPLGTDRLDPLMPLLSPERLGQFDSIASVYAARPVSKKISVHTRPLPRAVGLQLDDDSMGERFPAGTCVIFVDTQSPQAQDFVVAIMPGVAKACMRQWLDVAGRHFLAPLNRIYPATEVTPGCRVLGVVIEAVLFFATAP